MTRPLRWALLVALLAAIVTTAWFLTREKAVVVTLATVERGRVEKTVANTRAGTVEACQRARIAPAIGGQIARLPVRKGDRVERGETLLELWNEDLRAELVLAERDTVSSKARADEACATAGVARRDAERLERLRKQSVASVEAADKAAGEADARRAGCNAARSSAEVAAARVDVARAALERTILRAPFAGVVAELNGEVGEFVTPSPIGIPTPPAVDLIETGCLYVKAPIDEVDVAQVRRGMSGRITLDAFAGRSFAGVVRRVAPYVLDIEKQARTVDIEVNFADPQAEENLLPGYSADVEVVLSVHDEVLRVPTEAVLEGHRVLVYREGDGKLEERRIEPGIANWQFTEVTSGLEAGERIVLSVGRERVRAGARGVPEVASGSGTGAS